MGDSPLDHAALHGHPGVVAVLLAARCTPNCSKEGANALLLAAIVGGGPTMVANLIEARCNVEAAFRPRWCSPPGILFACLTMRHQLLGSRTFFSLVGYHAHGATPLMSAVVFNRVTEARALVAGGALRGVRNARGRTALELARIFDFPEEHQAMLRSDAEDRDVA